ncbi:nucleoside-diphosphate kinase [Streptococcus rifensis]
MQETLFIIKPDGVRRGLVGEVLRRIERRGFQLTRMELRQANKEILAKHYADLLEKPFYHQIETYMLEGPIVVGTFYGSDAVKTWRKTMGVTNPAEAELGTIRADFAQGPDSNGDMRNMVHGSDSVESAQREIAIWFGED